MLLTPDPTFYPSAKLAMQAQAESIGYVTVLGAGTPDSLISVDLDSASKTYGTVVGQVYMPEIGDEVHHFGWNACSSALCPNMPHPHIERRYLIVPGIRSNQLHVLDVKNNRQEPRLIKTISSEEIINKTGYRAPHTIHCGPNGVYVSALGAADGDGPGGIFVLDHETFDVLGKWEVDRGSQYLSYDFWWNLAYDTLISSEWATPSMFLEGLQPELLLKGQYGHRLHIWDLPKRRHLKTLDFGAEHQMVLEIRTAHDPSKRYGFTCSVVSLNDLSGGIWLWYHEKGEWKAKKVIEIPAKAEEPSNLPPILQGFSAVPPLITAIELSLDDRFLYVSCWGTGELQQYDVSDPFHPKLTGKIQLGGIAKKAAHPKNPGKPLNGSPQMACISLDGQRVYCTNSLYSSWDDQFYPDGIKGWMCKADVDPNGGLNLDPDFFIDLGAERPHQIRLNGGDASSDSFCYS